MTTRGETVSQRQVIQDVLDEVERELFQAPYPSELRSSLQVARAVLLFARLFTPEEETR